MANGRRRRAAAPREIRSEQSYSREEMAAVRSAAERAGMTAGSFIAQAAARAAVPGGATAGEALRGTLAELSETAWRIRHAHRQVDEAAGQTVSGGGPGAGLHAAAAELLAYAERFDAAVLRLRRAL